MELVDEHMPDRVRVYKEEVYGDKIKNKHELIGYKKIEKKPVSGIIFKKIIGIPATAGLVLLSPSYYTESQYNCPDIGCSYDMEEWVIEDKFSYVEEIKNQFIKTKNNSGELISISVTAVKQSASAYENSAERVEKFPKKKVAKKKAVKTRKNQDIPTQAPQEDHSPIQTAQEIFSTVIYAYSSIAGFDLCSIPHKDEPSTEYKVRYQAGDTTAEGKIKHEDLANHCSWKSQKAIDAAFDRLVMPEAPE
jgi:hypothetical protein